MQTLNAQVGPVSALALHAESVLSSIALFLSARFGLMRFAHRAALLPI